MYPFCDSFLMMADNLNILKFTFFLQFISSLVILEMLVTSKNLNNKLTKYLFVILVMILVLLSGFATFLRFSTIHKLVRTSLTY